MSSSDSDVEDPSKIKATRGAMNSLFTSDAAASKHGSQSLKYEPTKHGQSGIAHPPSGGRAIALQGTAVAYRGDTPIGPSLAVVTVLPNNIPVIVIVNREKKPMCRVTVDNSMQLLRNETELAYCTLYDHSFQGHWTLMFKTPQDCLEFIVGVHTVRHFATIDGPPEPYIDLLDKYGGTQVGNGDKVACSYSVWLISRVGQTTIYTTGKNVEEVLPSAPKTITHGMNEVMTGIEDALIGMSSGGLRMAFIPPRKTKASGIPNPEIGAGDSVVVLLECHSVEKMKSKKGILDLESDEEETFSSKKGLRSGKGASKKENLPLAIAPSVAQTTPAPGTVDTNTLLQTMLLAQLQTQQKSSEPSVASPVVASKDIERSIDRLHYQIQSLYEKMDRLEIDKHLQKNNEVIEKIVKKAVGKMPVNDVDVEDMAKDRNALLAKIEQLKSRLDEMTDSYHKALETLGKHKDETTALKNDLIIERNAAGHRFTELKERRRLEIVDSEVKHRQELDKLREESFEEGKAKGYQDGYNNGKIDAIQITGSSSMEEMKRMLSKKDADIVELESKLAQMEGKVYKERREHADQVDSLNSLIKKFEERSEGVQVESFNDASIATKRVRKIMNNTYASIEAQFYATESKSLDTEEALAMVLFSIKTETRSAVDEIKNEAAIKETINKTSRNEVAEAYMIQTTVPDHSQKPSTGETEYDKMRKEIEEYEREKEVEALRLRQAHTEGPVPSDVDFSLPPPPGRDDGFDPGSLPLPSEDWVSPPPCHSGEDMIPDINFDDPALNNEDISFLPVVDSDKNDVTHSTVGNDNGEYVPDVF